MKRKISIISVLLVLLLLVVACDNKNNSIVGSWVYTTTETHLENGVNVEYVYTTTYTFNSDGTGTATFVATRNGQSSGLAQSISFTYTYGDSKLTMIPTNSGYQTKTCNCTIDGNTMTLGTVDSSGNTQTVPLTRQ